MTAFGQIGKGFLIGAAAVSVLAIIAAVSSTDALLLVALILLAVFGSLGIVFSVIQRKMFGSPARLRRIADAGVPGTGVIETVGQTAGKVGANPIMRLTLVIGVGQTAIRTVVPIQHVNRVMVGSTLPVLIDPDDPYAAVIDWARLDAA